VIYLNSLSNAQNDVNEVYFIHRYNEFQLSFIYENVIKSLTCRRLIQKVAAIYRHNLSIEILAASTTQEQRTTGHIKHVSSSFCRNRVQLERGLVLMIGSILVGGHLRGYG